MRDQFNIRMTAEDRRILARLQQLTGCPAASVIRIALRDMLIAREAAQGPLARTGT